MTWQVIVAFIAGAVISGVISGIVAYKMGRKAEYDRYSYIRRRLP